MNFLAGRVTGETRTGLKVALDGYADVSLTLPRDRAGGAGGEQGDKVAVGIRPEHFGASGKARLSAEVDVVENPSTSFAYATARNGGNLIVELDAHDDAVAGREAEIGFDPKQAFLFDAESGLPYLISAGQAEWGRPRLRGSASSAAIANPDGVQVCLSVSEPHIRAKRCDIERRVAVIDKERPVAGASHPHAVGKRARDDRPRRRRSAEGAERQRRVRASRTDSRPRHVAGAPDGRHLSGP